MGHGLRAALSHREVDHPAEGAGGHAGRDVSSLRLTRTLPKRNGATASSSGSGSRRSATWGEKPANCCALRMKSARMPAVDRRSHGRLRRGAEDRDQADQREPDHQCRRGRGRSSRVAHGVAAGEAPGHVDGAQRATEQCRKRTRETRRAGSPHRRTRATRRARRARSPRRRRWHPGSAADRSRARGRPPRRGGCPPRRARRIGRTRARQHVGDRRDRRHARGTHGGPHRRPRPSRRRPPRARPGSCVLEHEAAVGDVEARARSTSASKPAARPSPTTTPATAATCPRRWPRR